MYQNLRLHIAKYEEKNMNIWELDAFAMLILDLRRDGYEAAANLTTERLLAFLNRELPLSANAEEAE